MAIVTIESNRYTISEPLYQWDLNQVLTIYGLSLPAIPEIHFTNDAMDRAIVRQATMNDAGVISVEVPNSLLQKPYKIRAYVCMYEGDTFKSLYMITIPVEARSQPNDYTIAVDDEEVYSFNALENKLENVLAVSLARYDEINTKYEQVEAKYSQACGALDQAIDDYNQSEQNYNAGIQEINAAKKFISTGVENAAKSADNAAASEANAAASEANAAASKTTSADNANAAKMYAESANSSAGEAKEVLENIVAELAERNQIIPLFANSVEECTDQTKMYVLPDGYIYAYIKHESTSYKNFLTESIDANGDPYNNGQGWKANTRLNSSGAETTASGTEVTGFISLTVGDIWRFEKIKLTGTDENNTTQYFVFYDSNHTKLFHIYTHQMCALNSQSPYIILDDNGYYKEYNTSFITHSNSDIDWNEVKYFRFSAEEITDESIFIINDETIPDDSTYMWTNTGHAFIPADYEDRIISLEIASEDCENRLSELENFGDSINLPDYWADHCSEKADLIRQTMETAGRNKSAFLWYTDSHWSYNSKMSPMLLRYLCEHTSMKKVNFGGDIANTEGFENRDDVAYLYEWRNMVQNLPNHHSVRGNHDDDVFGIGNTKPLYGYLMAAEECPQIVRGGDFYYYIDEPNEKTRYLYLDTSECWSLTTVGDPDMIQFVVDALACLPNGWHIVAISHIWWLYADVSTPFVGDIPNYCKQLLDLFDAYNGRASGELSVNGTTISYDFSIGVGKVEFCIGGHTHADYDFTSDNGIPVLLTETDSKHIRSGLVYTNESITESSVSGVVADYDARKISVIRVGRGVDREINY